MANATRKTPTHAGWIVTPDGDMTEAHPALVELCLHLWEARAAGKDVDSLIDDLKRGILTGFDGLDPSCAILVEGVCRVTLKRGASRPLIKNIDAVRELLGARFNDLVDVKTSFVPTDKLLDMLSSADDALARALCEHIVIRTGDPTVAIVAA